MGKGLPSDYYANVRTNVLLTWVLSNGVLLVAILGGMKSTDAFGHDVGMTKVKGYLVFILAFTAIYQLCALLGQHCIFLLDLLLGNGAIIVYFK
ncbi:hypothetical protein BYT27DRAFT_6363856 [Phlegmacium glaucopus]|nr:hypothetical protein BYT27DRAFT_6363856 [Phlegmacium glaucopus]